jgi:hypothetical protein
MGAQAQRVTIPEAVARGGVSGVGTAPSGPEPTIEAILEKTDLVIVGTVGEPHSYLSQDQLDVNTDFPVKDATVFYYKYPPAKSPETDNNTQQALTLTQLGGSILIDGKRFTQLENALPALQPGTKGLFLLQRRGDKYWIAGPSTALPFYGAFSITPEDKLMPLMGRRDFAPEYRNLKVSERLGKMMNILHSKAQDHQNSAKADATTK